MANITINLAGYATEEYVDDKLESYALKTEIPNLTGYATESYVNETIDEAISNIKGTDINLDNYAKKTEIPTNTSQLTNDSGYLTSNEIIRIEVVDALPETETPGVLYIVKG